MMEGLLKKDKSYTYDELKEIYKEAMMKTMDNPTGTKEEKEEKNSAKLQFSLMLSGLVLFHTMEDNLFGKENNIVEFKKKIEEDN